MIPKEAAAEIEKHCNAGEFDLAKLKKRTEAIGYPVLPVVEQLVGLCANGLGEWAHWGATTQDITDTAAVLQIREALALIEEDLGGDLRLARETLAEKYRDTPMAGRSNLQQAVPVTFGYKMAVLLAAIERHRERLAEMRPRVLVGEFGGAAGTLASLGKRRARNAGRAYAGARSSGNPRSLGTRRAIASRKWAASSDWSPARWARSPRT